MLSHGQEDYYAVASELDPADPEAETLATLDPATVLSARRHAAAVDLPWPPLPYNDCGTVRRYVAPLVAGLAVIGILAGCGAPDHSAPKSTQPRPAAPVVHSPAPAQPVAAAAVLAGLRGTYVTARIVSTPATDPNSLLGRPGGYLSRASWEDTRIPATDREIAGPDAPQAGGSIEGYPTAAAAETRRAYVVRTLAANPIIGAEYDYVSGNVLVRISGRLTPSQAAGYRAEIRAVTGAPTT